MAGSEDEFIQIGLWGCDAREKLSSIGGVSLSLEGCKISSLK